MISKVLDLSILLAVVLCGSDCRKARPPAPEQAARASTLPRISVKPDSQLLLTYYSHEKSDFETANTADAVPEHSRSWVRVIDLTVRPDRRLDHELVYVADLRKAQGDGTFPYVVMSRRAFEERARNLSPRQAPGAADGTAPGTAGPIILYATAWCPACKAARSWLKEKGLAFVEKDIEKNPSAAAELMSKAQRAGLSTNGVPVLDVRGTLVQGFDATRILSLLGGKT